MANSYEVNNQIHSGTLNGVSGKWVPVEASEAPAGVSSDPTRPSMSASGEYYYAQENIAYNNPAPIGANMNNAIPTPSSIVQLPPIVQPIAMVPYTTQNQPLVQYDPNYRPPVEHTASPEPVYRPKAYAGISAFVALFAIAAIVVGCLLEVYKQGQTVIKSLLWLFQESGAIDALISGDTSVIFTVLVPIVYAVIFVLCLITMVYALVKLGKMKPMAKFNVCTLIALLLAVAEIVVMIVKKDLFEIGIGAYVIAGIIAVMLILPLFINKKVQVLDYVASKQTYVIK